MPCYGRELPPYYAGNMLLPMQAEAACVSPICAIRGGETSKVRNFGIVRSTGQRFFNSARLPPQVPCLGFGCGLGNAQSVSLERSSPPSEVFHRRGLSAGFMPITGLLKVWKLRSGSMKHTIGLCGSRDGLNIPASTRRGLTLETAFSSTEGEKIWEGILDAPPFGKNSSRSTQICTRTSQDMNACIHNTRMFSLGCIDLLVLHHPGRLPVQVQVMRLNRNRVCLSSFRITFRWWSS